MRRSRYKELTLVLDLLFLMILSSSVRSQLSEDDLTLIKVCSANTPVGADNLIFFNLSSQTPEIPIWESRLGDMLCEEGSCGVVQSIAISSLNHYIAVGTKSGHVMLFSPETPSEVPDPNDAISFTNLFLLFIIFGIFIILLQLKKKELYQTSLINHSNALFKIV